MKIKHIIILLIFSTSVFSQKKVNTDSLLTVVLKDLKDPLLQEKVEKDCRIAIKYAPKYYDFHMVMGQLYQKRNKLDSCRKYFNIVIDNAPNYKEAYTMLGRFETQERNKKNALAIIDKGLYLFPNDSELRNLKVKALLISNSNEESNQIVDSLLVIMPKDSTLLKHKKELEIGNDFNKIGIEYSYTFFNREQIGPWHLAGLHYIYTKKKLTFISRLNYAYRTINNTVTNDGFQLEFESYYKHTSKNYSYGALAIGEKNVFPQLRLGYSFFQYLGKGFEGDIGIRYAKTPDVNLYAFVLGAGKYIGSYWLNARAYLQLTNGDLYPVFVATGRYYYNTKYDYYSVLVGYGTSPDERMFSGVLNERVSLKSYRLGVGYNRFIFDKLITGINLFYNNQEYTKGKTQNEYTISLLFQYKL